MTAAADHSARTHMDAIYRHQRHFYDITRKYYLLGRDAVIRDLTPPPGGLVTEIGCGTGRNLILAARHYPEARFLGIDVSAEMLDTAAASVRRAGLADRIALSCEDASVYAPYERPDRIFLSYVLSMIPPWRATLDRAARALNEGGRLEIVDFGQQERLPAAFRAMLFAWLGRFDVTPRPELFDEVGSASARHRLIARTMPLHRGYAWRATLSRAG